jgi:hypothetical protein
LIGGGLLFTGLNHGTDFSLAGKSVKDPTCTLSAAAAGGAPLTLTGSGYAPGVPYGVNFLWPNGTQGGVGATADSSGSISVSTYAWWAGTYTVNVVSTSGRQATVTTCSLTLP